MNDVQAIATRPQRTRRVRGEGPPTGPLPPPALHLELASAIERQPREVGVVLIGLGAAGLVIPGPIPPGAVFVAAGILVFRPGLIARFGAPLARRFPRVFRFLIGFFQDLGSGLQRRYPACVAV